MELARSKIFISPEDKKKHSQHSFSRLSELAIFIEFDGYKIKTAWIYFEI